MKLIKVNDRIWINPERIERIERSDFLQGYLIYFGYLSPVSLSEAEFVKVKKELGLK